MRLQVAIHRHTLPLVNLIFNTTASSTAAAGGRINTVCDFLSAVNALVPLESSDGEWGLEEYVVELIGTATSKAVNQHARYECLHYQLVEDVFRENDRIVVRGLTSDELRERRRGGRLQITADGRRLVDGVAWGGRFRPLAQRPGVVIPPRKRRRLLLTEDEDQDQQNGDGLLQIEYPDGLNGQVGFILNGNADEDEDSGDDYEDDEDYDGGEDGDQHEDDSASQDDLENGSVSGDRNKDKSDHPHEVKMSTSFDDADIDGDEDEDEDEDQTEMGYLEPDEIERLLAEAAALDEQSTSKSRKRKRSKSEGKSVKFIDQVVELPSSSAKKPRIGLYTFSTKSGKHSVDDSITDDSDHSSESSHTSSDLESPTNSSESSSEDDSDDSTSSSGSDTTSSSDSDNSDTSDSTSSSGSDTSSDESEHRHSAHKKTTPETTSKTISKATLKSEKSTAHVNGVSDIELSAQKLTSDNPPGSGTIRTKKNNGRVARRKRLIHLKEMGLLPADADFAVMKAYDDTVESSADAEFREVVENPEPQRSILNDEQVSKTSKAPGQATTSSANDNAATPAIRISKMSEDNTDTPQSTSRGHTDKETPTARARLDIESTRRLLFGSLGLRAPKDKAAEDKLREKLTLAAQKTQKRIPTTQVAEPTGLQQEDASESWKKKLIISAVECVQEGRILTAPPFPFKQHWERAIREVVQEKANGDENVDVTMLNHGDIQKSPGDQKTVDEHLESSHYTSQPLEMDDMPYPNDFELLQSLQKEDVVDGAIIAYKELHMNARFEPVQSAYHIARVTSTADNQFTILLSKGDRRELSNSTRYDQHGDRLYHGFELPGENDEIDDGLRELSFENLIQPKLIKAGNVQVPASVAEHDSQQGHLQHDSAIIPESAPALLKYESSSAGYDPHDGSLRGQSPILDASGDTEISFIQPNEYPLVVDSGNIMPDSALGVKVISTGLDRGSDAAITSVVSGSSKYVESGRTNGSSSSHQEAQRFPMQGFQSDTSVNEFYDDSGSQIQESLQPVVPVNSALEIQMNNQYGIPSTQESGDPIEASQDENLSLPIKHNHAAVDHNANADDTGNHSSEFEEFHSAGILSAGSSPSMSAPAKHQPTSSQLEDNYNDEHDQGQNENQSQDTATKTTRSSQRLNNPNKPSSTPSSSSSSKTKPVTIDQSNSAAAKMMKSALAGLGSRRSLQQNNKTQGRKKGAKAK